MFRFAAREEIFNHEGSAAAPNFWGEFFGSFFARQKMNVKTLYNSVPQGAYYGGTIENR